MPPAKDPTVFCQLIFRVACVKIFKETEPLVSCFNLSSQSPLALIESQNHRVIDWKRPLRSWSPTVNPTPPCLLNRVPKCHIYKFFKHLQGWWTLCAKHSSISAVSQAGFATGTEHHVVDAALLFVPPDSYLKLSQACLHGLQPFSDCSINASIILQALETYSKNPSPPSACLHGAGAG